MGCAGMPPGDGGSTKPDKAAACSAPDKPNVNGRRIASGIVIIAAMAAHGRFPQLRASCLSQSYLDAHIIAREYGKHSDGRLVAFAPFGSGAVYWFYWFTSAMPCGDNERDGSIPPLHPYSGTVHSDVGCLRAVTDT
jgi:hypothetical protein